ncbi:MAG: dTDP-4-dehydrorhamnose reductase [Betaproteobacteria bacterium]|nr:dTDP-4-dehydrorhamnose reductase [Betaproteobacteria bacterium]
MKLLVTGVNGQVGWELARSLMPLGEVIAIDRTRCDFSRPETIAPLVRALHPDVIVNAAAYTAVDSAEKEEALATTVNGTAVGVLAEEARKISALLVHYSTDYVFDGTKSSPYVEEDTTNPLNAYGRSKLAGEAAIRAADCAHIILRTTWVYAARGQNFVKTILRLARERDELNIVADQFGAPTGARYIADATAHIVRQAERERAAGAFSPGTFHCTMTGSTSWHGFAEAIIHEAARSGLLAPANLPKLNPIPASAYTLVTTRPANSRLDCNRLSDRFDIVMPDWRVVLVSMVDELSAFDFDKIR